MFRRILSGVRPAYLIRAWLIGAVFLAIILFFAFQNKNGFPYGLVVYSVICTILFPFSKLVWDEMKNLIMGNNIFVMNALMLMLLKYMVNAVLWVFAPFIAILGIGYIWYRTREV